MKKIPIGIEDFQSIIEDNYYFVDKTPLIEDIIKTPGLVKLITRPRRFGKSLNMSMLQHFFDVTENNNRRDLFDKLCIAEKKEICNEYMGQYPVINISFLNAKQNSLDDAMLWIGRSIADEFRRHIQAVQEYAFEKEIIAEILAGTADYRIHQVSLNLLSQILYDYHGKKVIILIDEYDVPLEAAFSSGFYDEMLNYIRSLLRGGLKGNKRLAFAVLTGCLRVAKESVFTGLNNFITFTITDSTFSKYFGFTHSEVCTLLSYYGMDEKREEMMNWYDGYLIGDTKIYNPWSVMMQTYSYTTIYQEPVSHWANTSGNEIIQKLIEDANGTVKDEIETLLNGQSIHKSIDKELTYAEIYDDSDNLWNFLLSTGYLTVKEESKVIDGIRYAELVIPNKEVQLIFLSKVKAWFEQKIEFKASNILDALFSANAEKLQKEINSILIESISYMDSTEAFYHGIMTGLLTNNHYNVDSNKESGNGRFDIVVKSKFDNSTAAIIEIKKAKSHKGLEDLAQVALKQIDELKYDTELIREGYRKIIKVGICFYKKSCYVLLRNN